MHVEQLDEYHTFYHNSEETFPFIEKYRYYKKVLCEIKVESYFRNLFKFSPNLTISLVKEIRKKTQKTIYKQSGHKIINKLKLASPA